MKFQNFFKINPSSLKRTIFVPFFLFIFLFLLIATISIYKLQKDSIENEVSQEYSNINTLVEDKLRSNVVGLRLFGDKLKADEKLLVAFASNDRDRLKDLVDPYLVSLQSDFKSNHLKFINPDGVVVHRTYNDNYNDLDIKGEAIKNAIQLKTSYFYIENGKYTELYLRIIIPCFKGDEFIGFIEVGKKLEEVLQDIAQITHMDFVFCSDKKVLSNKVLSDLKDSYLLDNQDTLVIYWSTFSDISEETKNIIQDNIFNEEIKKINFLNGNYLSKSISLNNFDNTSVGRLLVLHNNSLHIWELQSVLYNVIILSIFLVLLISYFFNKILTKFENNLKENKSNLEEELLTSKKLDKKLKESVNELKQLTLIASHDLRGPLTSLEGLLGLIKENPHDAEFNEMIIDKSEGSVLLMKKTIDSLTEIMQQRENLTKKEESTVVIEDVFNNVKFQLSDLLQKNNISLYSDFSGCNHFRINELHMNSILINLINNSIKYSADNREEGSKIEVITSELENKKSILINDNGLGFDVEKQKDHLFKPFKRFHYNSEGSGIGMYLTKLIVESYDGTIEIESKVNKGTTVKITF